MQGIKEFISANDAFARHVGIELLEVDAGRAKAKLDVAAEHKNGLGIVHGAAIFALADLAFAAASNSHGTAAVAVNANVNFMRATHEGVLFAEATETSRNHKLATYDVAVTNGEGELVAGFTGMVYRKKDSIPVAG
ncbi:MAG: hotdog fold thioesterase [Desulfovibrio sp.]|nr:MAG: hotdog fold thioesterase [Desulfovibrio sp.]